MKKRLLLGSGILLGSTLMLWTYAAVQFWALSSTQTNFIGYSSNWTLTESMWIGLVEKLDYLAKNHEARISALEGREIPTPPAPTSSQDCAPQNFKFDSIKFTTFHTTETLRNGESRAIRQAADSSKIRSSAFPNGEAPTRNVTVRCENGKIKLADSTPQCANGKNYAEGFWTCGASCTVRARYQVDSYICPSWSTAMNGKCSMIGQPNSSTENITETTIVHWWINTDPDPVFGNGYWSRSFWRQIFQCDNWNAKKIREF